MKESQAITALGCPTIPGGTNCAKRGEKGNCVVGQTVISQAIVLAVFLLPMGLALIRGDKGSFLLTPVFNALGEWLDTDGREKCVLLVEYSVVGRG